MCRYVKERECYEHLPASHNQSEGDDDPIVYNPARSLPIGELGYFTIAKEAAIFQFGFLLKARGMATYKAAHNGAKIGSKHRAPKESESKTKGLNVGADKIVAPTLGAKHGSGY